MNPAHEVLHEVKERRLSEQRIEALKQPWYRALFRGHPSLPVQAFATALVVLAFFTGGLSPEWRMGVHIAFVGVAVWSVVSALNVRDRMWRDLIRREAPELHEQLEKKD